MCVIYRISTHTLTWSVTHSWMCYNIDTVISTHTLTWSVTSTIIKSIEPIWFQLTRSRGAWRLVCWYDSMWSLLISTHTLTWSVTKFFLSSSKSLKFQLTRSRGAWRRTVCSNAMANQFQLTRSRGAWPVNPLTGIVAVLFQLTRSRGAWRASIRLSTNIFNFNSHAHVERDNVGYRIGVAVRISTHTLTWSVTRHSLFVSFRQQFQLTRSRGAWH